MNGQRARPPPISHVPNDAFFGHVPHFLLWMLILGLVVACGAMIADALELQSSRKAVVIAGASIGGMVLATLVMH